MLSLDYGQKECFSVFKSFKSTLPKNCIATYLESMKLIFSQINLIINFIMKSVVLSFESRLSKRGHK